MIFAESKHRDSAGNSADGVFGDLGGFSTFKLKLLNIGAF